MNPEQYVTVSEAAAACRSSDQTIRRRLREGALDGCRIGNRVWVCRRSLERYLSSQQPLRALQPPA